MSEKPAGTNPIFDAITGHNRVVILFGGALGVATALATTKGFITPDSAIPAFGWIVFGLLVFELAYGMIKNAPPAALISMPGRLLALVAGVGVDILARNALGTT